MTQGYIRIQIDLAHFRAQLIVLHVLRRTFEFNVGTALIQNSRFQIRIKELVTSKKQTEGPRICMKTKNEKSDILEGPRMLMKNKPLKAN